MKSKKLPRCVICDKRIKAPRRRIRCSPKCAVEHNRRVALARHRTPAKLKLWSARKCGGCGKKIGDLFPNARYCSHRCKLDAFNLRYSIRRKSLPSRCCIICEELFVASRIQIYCSPACRIEARRSKDRIRMRSSSRRAWKRNHHRKLSPEQQRNHQAKKYERDGEFEKAARVRLGLRATPLLSPQQRRERLKAERERKKIRARSERLQFLAMKKALAGLGVPIPEFPHAV